MIKILIVVPSYPKISGVDYHRLLQPHKLMGVMFESEIEISLINELDSSTNEFLSEFDLIVANRFISRTNGTNIIERLKYLKVPYVLDLDDDYRLPEWHILKENSDIQQHAAKIKEAVSNAFAVTCTHELMANTLKVECNQYNSYIVPNGINTEIDQYKNNKIKSDRIRFGWSGSITHFEDVLLMHDQLLALYKQKQYKDKYQVIYGGYSVDDETSRAIAGVLSCKGIADKENFATFPSTSIDNYARFYDQVDVSLIPLRNNRFNNLKSNLKLIESGFKKCAVIVSNVFPYTPMLKHGVNCLVVKNKHDWYRHMVKLIENPNMIEDLSEQLYIDVQAQHMEEVVKTRFETYKKILKHDR